MIRRTERAAMDLVVVEEHRPHTVFVGKDAVVVERAFEIGSHRAGRAVRVGQRLTALVDGRTVDQVAEFVTSLGMELLRLLVAALDLGVPGIPRELDVGRQALGYHIQVLRDTHQRLGRVPELLAVTRVYEQVPRVETRSGRRGRDRAVGVLLREGVGRGHEGIAPDIPRRSSRARSFSRRCSPG